MRVGIFTESYFPLINGVSTSIHALKCGLEKAGHEVFIITVNDDKVKYDYNEKEKIYRIPSLPMHCYDYRFTSLYPIKAIKQIKSMNLDVIHTHVEFTIGMFARIVSKQLSIPLVHTYHTMWEDYTHYVTHGNKVLDVGCKEIVKYLSVFFADKTTTELIVPTQKIYNLFREKYNVSKNIYIIPTGIEIEKFNKNNFDKKKLNTLKKSLGIKRKDFVILSINRLAKEKSIDRIIKNHVNIIKKYPNIKLLIVGDGPDRDILENLVKDLKIEKNVIFTGKIPYEKVPIYYQISNVFVTASKSETQGLTVPEAMASSLPVVVVNDESFIRTVINNLNGYIFDTDEEYIDSVLKLYNDKKIYEQFSRESKILSLDHSSKYFSEKVLEVYKEAINNYNNQNKKISVKISNMVERIKISYGKNRSSKFKDEFK